MGGDQDGRTEKPGQGLEEEQLLLYAQDIAKQRGNDLSRRLARAGAPTRVLLVDDDPSLCLLVSTTLGGEGYALTEVRNGESALAVVEEQPPDLILLDVAMPGLSGFEVCRRLRSHSRFDEVRIVLLTAVGDKGRAEGVASGADAYLVKPFRPMELLNTIHMVLRKPRKSE